MKKPKITMSPEVAEGLARRGQVRELIEHVRGQIEEFRMDYHPDADWGEFGKGYLQALDEVKDHLETLL